MRYLNERDILSLGIDWQRNIDVIEEAARTLAAGDFAQPVKP